MAGSIRIVLELAKGIYRNTFKQFKLLQGELDEESLHELLALLEERENLMALATKINIKDGKDQVKKEVDEIISKTWDLNKQNIKVLKDTQGDILSKLENLRTLKKVRYIRPSLQTSGTLIDQEK